MTDAEAMNDGSTTLSGRCGTCKRWKRYSDAFDVDYHGKHAGTCDSDQFVYGTGPQPPKAGLLYWDYEGYSAGFNTGEDFGCVHWSSAAIKEQT